MHVIRALVLSSVLSFLSASTQPIVTTSLGRVAGKIFNGAKAFLGIPYAASTGGLNRFRPPIARKPWNSTRQAVDFAPGCVQTGVETGPGADVPGNQSEDCLNVNVYAPLNASEDSALAVFFFLHGGAFTEGWNVGPRFLYEASVLARQEDITVFVPNYRLQALGFLNLPELGLGGNYGIMDQRFALFWVAENAKAFGGDPARITIAGQSAGAMSVGIHMVSPSSRGLFQRAIMESNVGGFKYKAADGQKALATSFVSHAGCSRLPHDKLLQCLQRLTSEQVRTATGKAEDDILVNLRSLEQQWGHFLDVVLPWTPTVGTPDLPIQVQDAFMQGKVARVPLLQGTNRDEGVTFIGYGLGKFSSDVTGLEYSLVVDFMLGDDAHKVKERYPSPGVFESASPQIGKIVTDNWFKCGTQKLALYNTQAGQETYNYRFSHPNTAAEVQAYSPALPDICVNITCHSTEIPSIFGSGHYAVEASPLERSIIKSMMHYWGSFIRGGTPVDAGGAMWPSFNEDRAGLLLGDEVKQESEADLCKFWDSIGYPRALPKGEARQDRQVLTSYQSLLHV